ncbi:MAG TPA: PAS domain-containing protein [Polyangiales bacterium]|nr:PAS domain-containing protein [Polyangiales bacterium]
MTHPERTVRPVVKARVAGFGMAVRLAEARAASLRNRARRDPTNSPEWLSEALRALDDAHAELQAAQEALNEQADELLNTRVEHELEWQRYRDLFEAAPIAYLETDPRGDVVEANRRCCELLNVRPFQLVDKPLVRFVSHAERDLFHRSLQFLGCGSKQLSIALHILPRSARTAILTHADLAVVQNAAGAVQSLRWTFSIPPKQSGETPA